MRRVMRRNLIYIRGIEIPEPSNYNAIVADSVDNARNVGSVVIGSVVREDQVRIDADYNYLTALQWSGILKLFNSKYGGSFYNDVTFFNPVTADWDTRKMYISNRDTSNGAFMIDPSTGAVVGWKGPHLALIEV